MLHLLHDDRLASLLDEVRNHSEHRLASPALIADGYHARTDGFVSLAVLASAIVLAAGVNIADPIIGLAISVVNASDFRLCQRCGPRAASGRSSGSALAHTSREIPAGS